MDQDQHGDRQATPLSFEQARHLYNRFGFGGTEAQLSAATGLTAPELLESWTRDVRAYAPRSMTLITWDQYGCNQDGNEIVAPSLIGLSGEEVGDRREALRTLDKNQYRDYMKEWLAGAHEGKRPLHDRMVLFWMEFFPTSVRATLRRYELVMQHQMMRQKAMSSFAEMLKAIVHDAAMLGYFDNDTNSKHHPNENFARELLELYSLGEGNYSERDVREAARALTGYQGETGAFVFVEELHDFGEKTILGKTGTFDGEGLVELLLEQPACARHVAGRLLLHFEGVPPKSERLEDYARALRANGYQVLPFLTKLASDQEFYSAELVGLRVAAPLEWILGFSRRLDCSAQPFFAMQASSVLGQTLHAPPSVKGWNGGEAWLTHSSLVARESIAATLLGLAERPPRKSEDNANESADERRRRKLWLLLHASQVTPPQLSSDLDDELMDESTDVGAVTALLRRWLAREATEPLREELLHTLRMARAELEQAEGSIAEGALEGLLRQLALITMCSPEAQLC